MKPRSKRFLEACADGNEDVIINYIESGYNINVRFIDLAFHPACTKCRRKTWEFQVGVGDIWNGLEWACIAGHINVIAIFIKAGIDIDARDSYGCTGLDFACMDGNLKIIEMLIEAGVRINSQDNSGRNVIHRVCRFGHTKALAMLIAAGVDVNLQIYNGRNALDIVRDRITSVTLRLELISTLINAGITLRSQDLQIDGVQDALDENAAHRSLCEQVMIEVGFPQRATQCEDVLNFLFRP